MDFTELAISATQIVALTEVLKKFFKGKTNIFYVVSSLVISAVVVLSQEYLPPVVMEVLLAFSLSTLFYDTFVSNIKAMATKLFTKGT